MKYKVGNKVRIKSLDWYNENKDEYGDVICGVYDFTCGMTKFCGKIVTIQFTYKHDCYTIKEDSEDYTFTSEMIEGLVEDDITDVDKFQDDNEITDIIDEYVHRLKGNEYQIDLPKGYQFTDEDGNIINATKIVLEKKNEYLKTYEECCEVLEYIPHTDDIIGYKWDILQSLQQLFICRDAYWKIAGEEMGLEKPWEPDWKDGSIKYVILYDHNEIHADCFNCTANRILSFPTEEMRDAFYENFKELIEQCKKLL